MPIRASADQVTRSVFTTMAPMRAQLAANDAETLETQIAVSAIPAPTGAEQRRAAWMAQRLAAAGLEVSTDAAGNVIARLGSRADAHAKAPVVVAAHLDTVFPLETELRFVRDGPRVAGPGICDNGRGLAAMLSAAQALAGDGALSEPVRPIEFVATVGEEGDGNLRGARHYFANNPLPFAFVALDGADDRGIVTRALGSRRFRVEYRGPGGHSWAAHGTPNPVHAAARCAATIAQLRMPRDGYSCISVTRIGGGVAVNSIPEGAWLDVDARSTSEGALAQLERDVRGAAQAALHTESSRSTANGAPLTCSVVITGSRPAGVTPEDSPVVSAALEATRLVGVIPELSAASTDANVAASLGVPCVAIGGGGRGGDAHTSHEWFDNTHGAIGVSRVSVLAAALARLAAD